MIVIGLLNQKGGVGKTTLAIAIAAVFAMMGYRVLLVDVDPQGSALDWAAARQGKSLFSVVGLPRASIHKEIASIGAGYDIVILDGPPQATELARSAILACDLVVIPVQPSPYDIWAAEKIIKLVEEARVYKENLKACFAINRKIANTAIGRDVREALAGYPLHVLDSAVTQRVVFAEAAAAGQAVWEVDPDSPASAEARALATEILEYLA